MVDSNRRDFLGLAVALSAAAGAASLPTPALGGELPAGGVVMDRVFPRMAKVRFGFIGVGVRGAELMRLTLAVEGAEVVAVCDTDKDALSAAAEAVRAASGRRPKTFTGSDAAYKELVALRDVDVVLIATPWEWHLPMALDAMNAGKQTLIEVPAVMTVADAWKLVETSERRQVNCMMLENCVYDQSELMVLNMVRAGLLGEITHAEGAYIHNLRWLLDNRVKGEGKWRAAWYRTHTANTYPTHGLGPVAFYLDINRGDRFDYLVSLSSPARSLAAYARERFPEGDPRRDEPFVMGDMNSSLIKTAKGRSILLQHDVSTPRPYSRINLVQGTKGTFRGYPDRLALDAVKAAEEWIADLGPYRDKYGSVLWSRLERQAAALGGGHGGMDYVMLWRVVHCLRSGLPLDQNVYDAAAWSAIVELSESSARNRSRPVDFPDFTRGAWKDAKPVQLEDPPA